MTSPKDPQHARELLDSGDFTCVFVCGEKVITSKTRGVKPLLNLYESGQDFSSFSAADKVVGNGAAWLYTLLKVKRLYTRIISSQAKTTLEKFNIVLDYDELVPAIFNHDQTGFCPIETAVEKCATQEDALSAIKLKLQNMRII